PRAGGSPRRAGSVVPRGAGGPVTPPRAREEEGPASPRRVTHRMRSDRATAIDRVALVTRRPLPYVYVAREVLRSAGVPCQTFDYLPLAAEPYAAVLDLVFAFVASNFARNSTIALLRSPHLRFGRGNVTLCASDVAALDAALAAAGYLGEIQTLAGIVASEGAIPAGEAALAAARELMPLRSSARVATHLDVLLGFLSAHDAPADPDDPFRDRHLRARSAILGALIALRAAYFGFDPAPASFDEVAATI